MEKSLGRDAKDPTENLTYYDQEMQDCAESYCSYENEQVEEAKKHCPDPQMMCYALGALELFDGLYDILRVFQIRRTNGLTSLGHSPFIRCCRRSSSSGG